MQAKTVSFDNQAVVELTDVYTDDLIARAGAFQALFGVQPYIQVMGNAYTDTGAAALGIDHTWHQVVSVDTEARWKVFAAGMYQQVHPEYGMWRCVRFSSDKAAVMLNNVVLQAAAP